MPERQVGLHLDRHRPARDGGRDRAGARPHVAAAAGEAVAERGRRRGAGPRRRGRRRRRADADQHRARHGAEPLDRRPAVRRRHRRHLGPGAAPAGASGGAAARAASRSRWSAWAASPPPTTPATSCRSAPRGSGRHGDLRRPPRAPPGQQYVAEAAAGRVRRAAGHVCVAVADTDRAIDFYVDTLGFEKVVDVPMGDAGRWVEVALPGDRRRRSPSPRRRPAPTRAAARPASASTRRTSTRITPR